VGFAAGWKRKTVIKKLAEEYAIEINKNLQTVKESVRRAWETVISKIRLESSVV
jgi:hypothetical protein